MVLPDFESGTHTRRDIGTAILVAAPPIVSNQTPANRSMFTNSSHDEGTMTTGQTKARKSQLLAYIKYNPAFEQDYGDFEHHDIHQILDEFERRDQEGYRLCVDRMNLHELRDPVPI